MGKSILMTEEQKQRLTDLIKALGITSDNMTANPQVELYDRTLRVAPTYIFDVDGLTDEQHAALEALTGWRVKR